jgi:fructokinase
MAINPKKRIAGIGELLWDVLPEGKQMGGAPCNFAFHALQTGCEAYVISAVGKDKDGDEILGIISQLGLDSEFIQTADGYPTGTVSVKLDDHGNPEFTIHENVAWDNITWDKKLSVLAQEMDAVCFGSLAQRNSTSKNTIWNFLEATKNECLRVFDINLRQSFYNPKIILKSLEFASVLKLNEDELPVVAGILKYLGNEKSILYQLLTSFQLQLIAYTKGSQGSILVTPDCWSYSEVPKIKVADTVGAGDSFTAILICGLLEGIDLRTIHKKATEVAAFVCSQKGATPVVSKKLLEFM